MAEFDSDDQYIYYYGQESLRRSGVVFIVNKRVQNMWMQYLDAISKITEWFLLISKESYSISVIQVYALTSNAEEAEVEWFYEDLQDLLELSPKKDVLIIIGDWNAKVEVNKHLE